ncbi:Uncharacterised protein g9589 [Pycnogonum litorale]
MTGRQQLFVCTASLTLIIVTTLCQHTAQLEFDPIEHEPKVFKGAEKGFVVLRIRAIDRNHSDSAVTYNIIEVKDDRYFTIGKVNGTISSKRFIDSDVGHTFELLVVALAHGQTEVKHVHITVVKKNESPPRFLKDPYFADVLKYADPGTSVVQVQAVDDDRSDNATTSVIFRLRHDLSDPHSKSFSVDLVTGTVKLRTRIDSSVDESNVKLVVESVDFGSPRLTDIVAVNVNVKTISVPHGIYASSPLDTTIKFCWMRPKHGQIVGYQINFRQVTRFGSADDIVADKDARSVNVTSQAYTVCRVLDDLRPWVDYEFTVFGWNNDETGLVSGPHVFTTRPDFCALDICHEGSTCELLNVPPGYACHCAQGQYGNLCDKYNPCVMEPCDNFGVCSNRSDSTYICECPFGFYGRNCTRFNPCALLDLSPCKNGASCVSNRSNTYRCICNDGYYGKTCSNYNPCVSYPCLNAGECFNMSDTEFDCKCQPGFEGQICEIDIDECQTNPCINGGRCVDGINSFRCECAPGYTGSTCAVIEKCESDTIHNEYGTFEYTAVEHGVTIRLKCPYGSWNRYHDESLRSCQLNLFSGGVEWSDIDFFYCKKKGHDQARNVSETLKLLTKDPNKMSAVQLKKTVKQLESIVTFAIYDKRVAVNMLKAISNFMKVNNSVMDAIDADGDASSRLIDVINRYTEQVVVAANSKVTFSMENIDLMVSTKTSNRPDGTMSFDPKFGSESRPNSQAVSIKLPVEALRAGRNGLGETRTRFVAFSSDKLFKGDDGAAKRALNLPVLDATINNETLKNLTSHVIYAMTTEVVGVAKCVYWIPKERRWSQEGIVTIQSHNRTTCYSTHLTAFSVLLDPVPSEAIPYSHQRILSYISYIGCLISVVGLLLTIITYSLFRCLNKDRQGRILLNLCVSMFFMNVSFLVGALREERLAIFSDFDVCLAVAVLLHYFLLTSLCWMCVEAINMYKLLVRVFTFSEPHFMLKRCFAAWGIPAIIVGSTVGININYYKNKTDYCMLSPSNPLVYYISFLGPCCLILLINLVVFVLVCRVLCSPRMATASKDDVVSKRTDSPRVTVIQVKGTLTVMILLGVTWVFGAFAVGEAKLVFQYVFCICNSLQGFLIFVIRCLHYPEARKAWVLLLTTGNLKRHRGKQPTMVSSHSNSLQYKTSHNSVKTTNSDSTVSTLVYNGGCASWSRTSRKANRNDVKDEVEDLDKLYAKPVKKSDCQPRNETKSRRDTTADAIPPPIPRHVNYDDRSLHVNDLTSDSDVAMIDDDVVTSNETASPTRILGNDNWILKLARPEDRDDREAERDVGEIDRCNQVIYNYGRRGSIESLRRHTNVVTIGKGHEDEGRSKSRSSPNIRQSDDSRVDVSPLGDDDDDVSTARTNVINIKLGKRDKL